jgi:hypothetical protein
MENIINKLIKEIGNRDKDFKTEKISDGFHTFEELYNFRKTYNAVLFNEWHKQNKYDVHKSIKHSDNALCFGGGWFIVSAILPTGQISNHYKLEDWDLFKIPATDKCKHEWDGHTSNDVLDRLKSI